MTTKAMDLFGRSKVAYLLIESEKFGDWKKFLKDGMGMHLAHQSDDTQAWRVDSYARRVIIQRGPAEDVAGLGIQLDDDAALQEVLARMKSSGLDVIEGKTKGCALRGVKAYWSVKGPKGLPVELFVEPLVTEYPLDMLTSAFVTGDAGLGHAAITSREPVKMRRFWETFFDARYSDHIDDRIAGVNLSIDFLRLNERHHSIAIATTEGLPVKMDPIRTKIQHFNFQAATVDDLTGAYTRLRDLGYEMAHEMGQHPNDGELSFYAISPSGFEVELGWNPLVVDESTWTPETYFGMSSWGHRPEKPGPLHNLKNFQYGLKSALKPEFSPLA